MLLDEGQRAHCPNATDVAGIVTTTHDAQVNELLHRQLQLSQQDRQVNLHDGICPRRLHTRQHMQMAPAQTVSGQHSVQDTP